MGSQTMGYLTPDFLVARLGLPVRMAGPFGISIQAIPRFDYGRGWPATPAACSARTACQGVGLLLRTILAKFYVEGSYGFMRSQPGAGLGPVLGLVQRPGRHPAVRPLEPPVSLARDLAAEQRAFLGRDRTALGGPP